MARSADLGDYSLLFLNYLGIFSLSLNLKSTGSGQLCTRGMLYYKHSMNLSQSTSSIRLRKFLFKIENVYLPLETELSSTTRALCLDFKEHYLAECRSAIESDKRYMFMHSLSVLFYLVTTDTSQESTRECSLAVTWWIGCWREVWSELGKMQPTTGILCSLEGF